MFVFESLFAPEVADKHILAPLPWAREQFLAHLVRRGTGRSTLRRYAAALNQVVRFLGLQRLRRVRVSEIETAACRWADYTGEHRCNPAGLWSKPSFVWLAKRWLKFHGKLVVHRRRVPFACELKEYAAFMRSEGRLAPATIRSRMIYARVFLSWFKKRRPERRLSEIELSDVDRYFADNATRWRRVTLATCAANLRPFFSFAENRGWCSEGTARRIRGPAIHKASFIPEGPSWKDVLRLLRTTDGATPIAIRSKAILLLVSFYGLRRSEIADLRLNDLDWLKRTMTVRRAAFQPGQR